MKYSEIGSYFWLDENENKSLNTVIEWLPDMEDSCFTFSGRNAIDIAFQDCVKNQIIDAVFAPSYCCSSMLQAFVENGAKVRFYDVGYETGRFTYRLPECRPGTVVLIMNYFGMNIKATHRVVKDLKNLGAVVIEDITHSLLCGEAVSEDSDYAVASLRKWFPIPTGGWIGKQNGTIDEKPTMDSNQVVKEKIQAMHDKYDYLTGKNKSKEGYMTASAKFESDLALSSRTLKIDDVSLKVLKSIEIKKVISQRRQNVKTLIEGLSGLEKIMSIPQVDLSVDVPLFLPVIMNMENRDSLRRFLIENEIYCPVHWPSVEGAPEGIRENELSIICDQRYSESDMQTIVAAARKWAAETGALQA